MSRQGHDIVAGQVDITVAVQVIEGKELSRASALDFSCRNRWEVQPLEVDDDIVFEAPPIHHNPSPSSGRLHLQVTLDVAQALAEDMVFRCVYIPYGSGVPMSHAIHGHQDLSIVPFQALKKSWSPSMWAMDRAWDRHFAWHDLGMPCNVVTLAFFTRSQRRATLNVVNFELHQGLLKFNFESAPPSKTDLEAQRWDDLRISGVHRAWGQQHWEGIAIGGLLTLGELRVDYVSCGTPPMTHNH